MLAVCESPPDAPENGVSSSEDPSFMGVFLDGDVIEYSCDSSLFGIAESANSAVCNSSGLWTPSSINECVQQSM